MKEMYLKQNWGAKIITQVAETRCSGKFSFWNLFHQIILFQNLEKLFTAHTLTMAKLISELLLVLYVVRAFRA